MDRAQLPMLTLFSMLPVILLVRLPVLPSYCRRIAVWAGIAVMLISEHLAAVRQLDRRCCALPADPPCAGVSYPCAPCFQAAPVGVRAKASTRARNTVLLLGCLVGFAGDICFAFIPSSLGRPPV